MMTDFPHTIFTPGSSFKNPVKTISAIDSVSTVPWSQ